MKTAKPLDEWLRAAGLPLLVFLGLALYDALIGGAIAALLKSDGFTPLDQRINNVHQLAYAMVTTGTLVWLFTRIRNFLPVLALGVLFAGFVEDTLFYALIPFCNPLILVISGGAAYQVNGDGWMPERVSGWAGWVGRMAADQNVAFSRGEIYLINSVAVVVAMILLAGYARVQNSQQTGPACREGEHTGKVHNCSKECRSAGSAKAASERMATESQGTRFGFAIQSFRAILWLKSLLSERR